MDAYLSKLTQVLATVQAAGVNVNARSDPALNDARNAWSLLLKPEIPLDKLEAAILDTIKEKCSPNRTGNAAFVAALAATDVLKHWRSERYVLAEQKRLQANSVPKTCPHCNDTLQIRVFNPRIQEEVTKPCPFHLDVQARP